MKRLINYKNASNIKDECGIDSIGESNRDCAALYYDGKIWTGSSHGQILNDIQKKYKDYDLDYYDDNFAFLHMKTIDGVMNAFIEDTTPIPFNEIASAVRQKYPGAQIYSRSLSNGKDVQRVAKRLVKKALMDIEVLKGTLEQLSDEGREILRAIEDYKFKLEQASRVVSTDQMLTQKINQKQKILDTAAGQIYGIVFDIENIDITQVYEQEQLIVNNPGIGQPQDGEAIPTPTPGQPPVPNTPPAPANEEENDSAPSGGGPIPQGGSAAPAPKDEDSDDKSKDKEDSKDSKDNSKEDNNDEDLKEEDLPEEPKKE